MKHTTKQRDLDEMRPEYDFSSAKAVRGKHFRAYQAGTNVVLLEPDLTKAFPDSASVNQALRLLVRLSKSKVISQRRPNTYQPPSSQAHRSSPSGHARKSKRHR